MTIFSNTVLKTDPVWVNIAHYLVPIGCFDPDLVSFLDVTVGLFSLNKTLLFMCVSDTTSTSFTLAVQNDVQMILKQVSVIVICKFKKSYRVNISLGK